MKREAGWGTAALLAAAAVVGVNHYSSSKSEGGSGGGLRQPGHRHAVLSASVKSPFESGPCVDLETRLQTFLLTKPEGIAAPPSCYDDANDALRENDARADDLGAMELRSRASGLQYVIATLPDPVHTHFSLSFDRQAEAIQQGAQDEGYFYDSSWLPWETEEQPLVLLADQDKAEDETKDREDQPGILLFRKKPGTSDCPASTAPADQPYCEGLAVFIVGEEPTGGIHKRQFENAVDWIAALQPRKDKSFAPPVKPVKILGPTFSGSLPSFAQLLAEGDDTGTIRKLYATDLDKRLAIFSGGITDDALVHWFVDPARKIGNIHFHSFQQDGDTLLGRYRWYLDRQGIEQSRLAILSEDETAYGGYGGKTASSLCQPLAGPPSNPAPACFYYPRDLSALRAAYQKQGIFNAASSTQSSDAAQRELSSDLADPEGKEHDTIRSYSGDQTALSQEAVLKQIVTLLRAHGSQYIVLRSSNPLDQLFLSHFLRLAYPEGRIVIEGADLLLRREDGAAALSGILTLTTYPSLPLEGHWTTPPSAPPYLHGHRVFDQELSEGTYVAARFLLHGVDTAYYDLGDCGADDVFLPSGMSIPNYAPPFWIRSDPNYVAGACRRPVVWLSVLGRDGFWPVAALDEEPPSGEKLSVALNGSQTNQIEAWSAWAKQSAVGAFKSWWHLVPTVFGAESQENHRGWPDWPPMPLSMKLCLLAISLIGVFHLQCCGRPSLTVKPIHRAHFARGRKGLVLASNWSHPALILFGSLVLVFIPILLAWGFGAMSIYGEPLPNARAYRMLLPSMWFLGGAAVAANAWVESEFYPRSADTGKWLARCARQVQDLFQLWRQALKSIARPLVCYLALSIVCYLVAAFFLEGALWDSNRFPAYWRSIHLTTGVSPLLPLLALQAGLYLWFWYSLQGLALFGADRPQLPSEASLLVAVPKAPKRILDRLVTFASGVNLYVREWKSPLLCMFSRERAAVPTEALCGPFAPGFLPVVAAACISLWVVGALLAGGDPPIRGLGAKSYSAFFCLGLDLCVSLMLVNAWQLLKIWLRLHQLLVFLDRVPLRRTMQALKDISWESIWKMGGSVLDLRYRMLSRQLESLTHLQNALEKAQVSDSAASTGQIVGKIRETQGARLNFAEWYAESWDNWKVRDLGALAKFQDSVAETSGILISEMLVDHWRKEEKSLVLGLSTESEAGSESEEKKDAKPNPVANLPEHIQNAEELVCLVYIGFIQNVLGRIRTLGMQMLWLFIAVSISVATYPFDPRPALTGTLFVLFVILGTVIVIVYSQMHRDATLSLITNTNPGELGAEFWFKLVGFAAGPVLALLATVFPEMTGSLFSWLQPGIESIK